MGLDAVRRARPGDAAAIARVHVRGWQVAYRGIVPDAVLDALDPLQREARWREILAAGNSPERSFTLVAEREAAVVGFCSIIAPSRDDDAGERTCEVAAIYVDPEAWARGIGRALLETALREARADGSTAATLWVFAANHRARAFYEGLGFEPDGRTTVDEDSGAREIRMGFTLTAGDRFTPR